MKYTLGHYVRWALSVHFVRWTLLVLGAIAVSGGSAAQASWQVLVPAQSATSIPAAGLVVGDKTFSNFSLIGTAQGGGVAPTLAGFVIEGGQETTTGDYGIHLIMNLSAAAGQLVDGNLQYQVSVNNSAFKIKDASLILASASASGNGVVNVSEMIYASNSILALPIASLVGVVQQPPGVNVTVSNQTFSPVSTLYIHKDISASGGLTGSGHISEMYQTFSQSAVATPEPESIVMMATGGLFIGGIVIRNRKRRNNGTHNQENIL